MGVFSFVKAGKKTFDTIKSVKPNVPTTKLEKAKSKLAIAKQKTKTSALKLKNTLADIKEKATKRENKMGGGMMGRRMGYSQGSSKGKVPTTPKEKALAKLAPPKDKITFGDVVAGRTKGKRMQAKDGTIPFNKQKNIIDKQGKRGIIVGTGTMQKAPSKVLTKRKGSR
jgi:hypothetical protein